MSMMRDIVFWGAGGQAKVLREALEPASWQLVALVDNDASIRSPWARIAVLHGAAGLDAWLTERASEPMPAFAIAIGGSRGSDRLELMDQLRRRAMNPATIVHRAAFVATDATVGEGCQILAKACVCSHTRLGQGVIVNTGAIVDHDGRIDDGAHVGPGATLAGEVHVGARAFVGAGATVLPRVRIGCDAIVGAGAVVTHDVADATIVLGSPARVHPTRRHESQPVSRTT